jgi:PIN domain nuclease of toxin-antitoxin system
MRLLLDTQLFLWHLAASPKLSKRARTTINDAADVFVSAASIWEASVKVSLGKLRVSPEDLAAGIAGSQFTELPITSHHAVRVATLPPHHRDPFDRLLIAQTLHEQLRFLTADPILTRYSDLVDVVS